MSGRDWMLERFDKIKHVGTLNNKGLRQIWKSSFVLISLKKHLLSSHLLKMNFKHYAEIIELQIKETFLFLLFCFVFIIFVIVLLCACLSWKCLVWLFRLCFSLCGGSQHASVCNHLCCFCWSYLSLCVFGVHGFQMLNLSLFFVSAAVLVMLRFVIYRFRF